MDWTPYSCPCITWSHILELFLPEVFLLFPRPDQPNVYVPSFSKVDRDPSHQLSVVLGSTVSQFLESFFSWTNYVYRSQEPHRMAGSVGTTVSDRCKVLWTSPLIMVYEKVQNLLRLPVSQYFLSRVVDTSPRYSSIIKSVESRFLGLSFEPTDLVVKTFKTPLNTSQK